MKIATVLPLARGPATGVLTYFSVLPLAPGDLVTVPVRGKNQSALVLGTEPIVNAKTALRTAGYQLKKVAVLETRGLVRPELLEAARLTADYYVANFAPTLRNLIPQRISAGASGLGRERAPAKPELLFDPTIPDRLALQDTDDERFGLYKSLIREEFAKNQSVFVCAPTLTDLLTLQTTLARGIETYTILLHSSLTATALVALWRRAIAEPHPLLIIATPSFLSLPRLDLSTIIIERENHDGYRPLVRPLFDYRFLAEQLAKQLKIRLILGDTLLRTETLWRVERGELMPLRSLKQRLPHPDTVSLVTMKDSGLWTTEAEALLRAGETSGERTIILANRRGLSPLIVCDDCGQAVLCGNCEAPLSLHRATIKRGIEETSLFKCHHCGEERSSSEKCRQCRSWRLRALGTGVERVAEDLKNRFPKRPLFQLDSDRIKTPRAAENLIKKFLATPGAILIGTEMVVNYLRQPVAYGIVATIDAMLALPDFRINEKLLVLLARLRTVTKELVIQTRQEISGQLATVGQGQLLEFYRAEIAERERFHYPPFSLFIKLTGEGPGVTLRAESKALATHLNHYEPAIYPSLHQPGGGRTRLNNLLKVKPTDWPNERLLTQLKALPTSWKVTVDPETIL